MKTKTNKKMSPKEWAEFDERLKLAAGLLIDAYLSLNPTEHAKTQL